MVCSLSDALLAPSVPSCGTTISFPLYLNTLPILFPSPLQLSSPPLQFVVPTLSRGSSGALQYLTKKLPFLFLPPFLPSSSPRPPSLEPTDADYFRWVSCSGVTLSSSYRHFPPRPNHKHSPSCSPPFVSS